MILNMIADSLKNGYLTELMKMEGSILYPAKGYGEMMMKLDIGDLL